jgi:ubiquitin-like-conjugating enzyme ATG3
MIPNNSLFQSLKNTMLSNAHAVAETLTPVLTVSKFTETGVLTPQEFVEAGDMLVSKCPTWSWAAGDADKRRAHLPPNKQFLITRGVPCRRRVTALDAAWGKSEDEELVDGWLKTGVSEGEDDASKEYGSLENPESPKATSPKVSKLVGQPMPVASPPVPDDDYIDLEAYVEDDVETGDDATAKPAKPTGGISSTNDGNDLILRTRTYDLSIMYDKYYQTPRMFLMGYDEAGRPLPPTAVFEDISQDYANKTATIESHPHIGNIQCASIHPCKHAPIMKKFVDKLTADGSVARVDQALFIFLKFMQGLVPTIDYDFTMEVKFSEKPSRRT